MMVEAPAVSFSLLIVIKMKFKEEWMCISVVMDNAGSGKGVVTSAGLKCHMYWCYIDRGAIGFRETQKLRCRRGDCTGAKSQSMSV